MGDATHSYLGHDPHDPSEKTHMHRHIIDVGPWRGTVTWDRDVLIRETWLTHHVRKHTHTSAQHLMGDKTPLYLGHNFLISGTWFLYIWDINCITLLKIHTCVGTELMWDVTCWYVGHHAHTIWEHTHVVGQYWIGTWLIYTWDVTHMTHRKVHVCQHAIVCGMEPVGFDWFIYHMNAWCGITQKSPCPLWTRVSACNCMRDGTCGITQKSRKLQVSFAKEPVSPMNQSNPTCYIPHTLLRRFMGWLRLVGSLKLQVSFAKEPVSPMNQSNPTCYIPHTIRWDTGSFAETYGGATISRLLKITCLFCKRAGVPYEPVKFHMLHPAYNSVGRRWDTGSLAEMYGVATISRLLKIAGLFCKRAL